MACTLVGSRSGVSPQGVRPRVAPQSPRVPPADMCPPLRGDEFKAADVGTGSAATVRRQWEELLAGPGRRLTDPPMLTAAERQLPSCSGQPSEELANVRYRRPPTFAGQIRVTATSLERYSLSRSTAPHRCSQSFDVCRGAQSDGRCFERDAQAALGALASEEQRGSVHMVGSTPASRQDTPPARRSSVSAAKVRGDAGGDR
jgi:hypothetical protein